MQTVGGISLSTGGRNLGNILAGISVAFVLIPQSMAYAELAGLPAHRGLAAAALPPLAASLFASSPYLQTGPVALTSLLTLGALTNLASPGSPGYLQLAVLLALVVGACRVILGLLRLGVVAYLMSDPLMMGFTSAAAILIVASQLPAAVGVVGPPVDGVIAQGLWVIGHPTEWRASSVILAVAAGMLILALKRLHPLWPGVLLAAVGGLLVARVSGYQGPIVGSLPDQILARSFDLPWHSLPDLILPGVVIALVGFAEPAAIARTFAALDRQRWNPSRELISQGAANVAAGLAGGFPVGGSFSRSSLNRLSGATNRWSGAITGLTVLAFLPFAAVLAPLPQAILGAIVITAVLGMIRPKSLVGLWSLSRPQAGVAIGTFLLTLTLAPRVDLAVLVGFLLAVGVHLWRELRLTVPSWKDDDTLHLAPRGVLWFGSAPALESEFLKRLAGTPDARRLVIHMGGLGRVDLTGALVLKALVRDAAGAGVSTSFEEIPPQAGPVLSRTLGLRLDLDSVHGEATRAEFPAGDPADDS